MKILDSYLQKLSSEQVTTSAAAGITPYESPTTGKPLIKSPKGKPVVVEADVEGPKRIMVDFDVPIHRYSKGYFNAQIYDLPTEDAKEALQFLKNEGFEIVIFSSRVSCSEHPETCKVNEQAIRDWLDKNSIPFDMITSDKLHALVYIDDRAIRFSSWGDTIEFLKSLNFF